MTQNTLDDTEGVEGRQNYDSSLNQYDETAVPTEDRDTETETETTETADAPETRQIDLAGNAPTEPEQDTLGQFEDGAEANEEDTEDTTKLISGRPLWTSAVCELEEYDILEREEPGTPGRYEIIETAERPPVEVRDRLEVYIEEEPKRTYKSERGDTLEIYPDYVRQNGRKDTDADPEEYAERAEGRDGFREVSK